MHIKDRSFKNIQKKNIENSPKKQKKYDKFMSTLTKATYK